MRELRRRSNATAQIGRALFSLATVCLLVGPAAAQDFVRPGQKDVIITVEIENEADSGADIASAQVAATSADPVVQNIRVSPAAPVPIGQTKSFTVTFDVADTIPTSPDPYIFKVTVQDIIDDAVDPDPETYDGDFSFTVMSPHSNGTNSVQGPDYHPNWPEQRLGSCFDLVGKDNAGLPRVQGVKVYREGSEILLHDELYPEPKPELHAAFCPGEAAEYWFSFFGLDGLPIDQAFRFRVAAQAPRMAIIQAVSDSEKLVIAESAPITDPAQLDGMLVLRSDGGFPDCSLFFFESKCDNSLQMSPGSCAIYCPFRSCDEISIAT